MCWRIVRITGNGAIKLVLYNYNGLTDTNNVQSSNTPCNVTENNLAFARYEGTTYGSHYSINYLDNAYAGLMYGTTNSKSYAETHANIDPSTLLVNINRWYNKILSQQENFNDIQLADTIWCNDKSIITDSTYNPWNITLGTNYGYGNNMNYYGTVKRLLSKNNIGGDGTGPTLRCPNDNNGGKLSKFTVNDTTFGNGALKNYAKIGLLTADEVAFAGTAVADTSLASTYYLNQNTGQRLWYLSTPALMKNNILYAWAVSETVHMSTVYPTRNTAGVRPSISLVPSIKISIGTGTATDPYKIS